MLPECDGDGFGAVGGAKLGEYRVDMAFDAVFADAEFGGDVLVRETAGGR